MPAMIPFIPMIASLAGSVLPKLFGGGEAKDKGAASPTTPTPASSKNLFMPDQIKTAQDKYTQAGNAKWNQIMAGMGAGGGTGGPDVATQIGNQASSLGTALGQLNTDSGYGDNPMANMDAILKGVEGGISPKYSVYG